MINKYIKSADNFFFAPCKSRPLAIFRIGLGALLLFQAYFLRDSAVTLFSETAYMHHGFIFFKSSFYPTISNFYHLISTKVISEKSFINLFCVLYVLSLISLTLGLKVKHSAFFSWFFHLALLLTAPFAVYGFDLLSHVLLFYFIWLPSDYKVTFRDLKIHSVPTPQSRLALRYLQLYLCLIYLTSGLEKLKNPNWLNGEQLWRTLTMPRFNFFDLSGLTSIPGLLMSISILIIFFEIGYSFFIWHRFFRKFILIALISMHLGIMCFMGLQLFGLLMILFNVCVFIVGSETDHTLTNKPHNYLI